MTKTAIRPINTAFAVLFMLLVSVAILHVHSVSNAGGNTVAAMQMTSELERFRALERDLCNVAKHLRSEETNIAAKVAILDIELEQIENTLRDLGRSGMSLRLRELLSCRVRPTTIPELRLRYAGPRIQNLSSFMPSPMLQGHVAG